MKIKNLIVVILFGILPVFVQAQDYSGLKDIQLKEKQDYKNAETLALECSNFILTHSMFYKSYNGLSAVQFILRWMEGTPDFMFNIDDSLAKVWKQDKFIMGVYMACLTKYCLENPENAKNNDVVELNATKLFLNYVNHPDSGVKKTAALKKLIKADQEGKLNEFLKIQTII